MKEQFILPSLNGLSKSQVRKLKEKHQIKFLVENQPSSTEYNLPVAQTPSLALSSGAPSTIASPTNNFLGTHSLPSSSTSTIPSGTNSLCLSSSSTSLFGAHFLHSSCLSLSEYQSPPPSPIASTFFPENDSLPPSSILPFLPATQSLSFSSFPTFPSKSQSMPPSIVPTSPPGTQSLPPTSALWARHVAQPLPPYSASTSLPAAESPPPSTSTALQGTQFVPSASPQKSTSRPPLAVPKPPSQKPTSRPSWAVPKPSSQKPTSRPSWAVPKPPSQKPTSGPSWAVPKPPSLKPTSRPPWAVPKPPSQKPTSRPPCAIPKPPSQKKTYPPHLSQSESMDLQIQRLLAIPPQQIRFRNHQIQRAIAAGMRDYSEDNAKLRKALEKKRNSPKHSFENKKRN